MGNKGTIPAKLVIRRLFRPCLSIKDDATVVPIRRSKASHAKMFSTKYQIRIFQDIPENMEDYQRHLMPQQEHLLQRQRQFQHYGTQRLNSKPQHLCRPTVGTRRVLRQHLQLQQDACVMKNSF